MDEVLNGLLAVLIVGGFWIGSRSGAFGQVKISTPAPVRGKLIGNGEPRLHEIRFLYAVGAC
jgi:hypothetical protein